MSSFQRNRCRKNGQNYNQAWCHSFLKICYTRLYKNRLSEYMCLFMQGCYAFIDIRSVDADVSHIDTPVNKFVAFCRSWYITTNCLHYREMLEESGGALPVLDTQISVPSLVIIDFAAYICLGLPVSYMSLKPRGFFQISRKFYRLCWIFQEV